MMIEILLRFEAANNDVEANFCCPSFLNALVNDLQKMTVVYKQILYC